MLWLVICLVGLLAETALIVVLGRRATGAYGALPARRAGRRGQASKSTVTASDTGSVWQVRT